MEYLDRMNVHCPPHKAITSFRFERCHGDYFRYVEHCGGNSDLIESASRYHQTSCQRNRWMRMEYLDRHNVQCPAGEVLTHFRLTGAGCRHNHMKFQFWCRKAELGHWRDEDSSCQALRGKNGEYLDRQRPKCGAQEVMTGFQLHSGGCRGNDMRFRTRCAKVLMPWHRWGQDRKVQYKAKENRHYAEYAKELAKYRKLDYPNSPTGDRLKTSYEYEYRAYTHWRKKYEAVSYKRKAIKAERQWKTYRRDARQAAKANKYHRDYKHYEHLYMQAEGTLPAKPVVTYPNTPPKTPNYKDPNYWNRLWTNRMTEARMASVVPVKVDRQVVAPCSVGHHCKEGAHAFFKNATDELGLHLPSDPAWSKYPKQLVEDRQSDEAKFKDAMATSTFDPLDNADFGMGLSTERRVEANHAMFQKTGCSMGDKECLRKAGVWPGDGVAEPRQGVKDEESAVALMRRVDEHLDGTLPDEPAWNEYPKTLVENRDTPEARARSGLRTNLPDPLDNLDIGLVDGGHQRSRNQYRTDMREATGCDLGDVDCFEKFRKLSYPKHPKVRSDDCFGEKNCPPAPTPNASAST